MFTAYFDESGTHAQSKIVHIAGFVAANNCWSEFEKNWNEVLNRFDLKAFHATECGNAEGQFERMNSGLRDPLRMALADVFIKHNPTGINVAISRESWTESKYGKLRQLYTDPYVLCFEFCMQKVGDWSRQHSDGQQISLVFAEQVEYQSPSRRIYDLYKAKSKWSGNIASLTHLRASDKPALQAADFYAYEASKHVKAGLQDQDISSRPWLKKMQEAGMKSIEGNYDPLVMPSLFL